MRTLLVVYFALVVLALSACQKSNQEAKVPTMSTNCIDTPSSCNSNVYQQTPGYSPYGNQSGSSSGYNNNYGYGYGYGSNYGYQGNYNPFIYGNNSAYLCNCPSGSVPTYNSYAGLGCVQSTLVYGYFYASFGYSTNNSQWTNIPQISNRVSSSQGSCYNGVIQSCFIDSTESCMVGFSCRPHDANSKLGICVSNNALNSSH